MIIFIGLLVALGLLTLSLVSGFWSGARCKSQKRLDNKTIIVTGANCGIGYEVAMDLARRGARVILACRNITRGNRAKNDILAANAKICQSYHKPVKADQLVVERLDLTDLESVEDFCKNTSARTVDVLVCNAGIATVPDGTPKQTKQGFPVIMGTNHLGHFFLVEKIKNRVLANKTREDPGRIVIVASRMHCYASFEPENMFVNRIGTDYSNSKLANVTHAKELARRHAKDPLLVASVHPGLIATQINQVQFFNRLLVHWLLKPFTKTAYQGAQTVLHTILEPEIESGAYYADCAVTRNNALASKEDFCKRVWQKSIELLKL